MSRNHQDDAPEDTDHEAEEADAEVVPEAGEGPIPPVAGEPRPPIGN